MAAKNENALVFVVNKIEWKLKLSGPWIIVMVCPIHLSLLAEGKFLDRPKPRLGRSKRKDFWDCMWN
jgi:hypothetical protein